MCYGFRSVSDGLTLAALMVCRRQARLADWLRAQAAAQVGPHYVCVFSWAQVESSLECSPAQSTSMGARYRQPPSGRTTPTHSSDEEPSGTATPSNEPNIDVIAAAKPIGVLAAPSMPDVIMAPAPPMGAPPAAAGKVNPAEVQAVALAAVR
jgi:hypothetical protein